MIFDSQKTKLANNAFNLTGREKQVIELLCQNLTSQEIGIKLGINKRTVDNHCYKICHKLGVSSRFDVIGLWQQWQTD